MAVKGQTITASDYNVLVNSTNKVFADIYSGSIPRTVLNDKIRQGYGWGNLAADSANLDHTTKITAVLVNQLIDRINIGAIHTGSDYELDRVIIGQKITASIWNDIETVAADVDERHNIAAIGQTAVETLTTVTRSSAWDSNLTYTVNLDFNNYDQARYFFNSGSSINLSLTGTGSGTSASWQSVYTRFGVVSLKLTNTLSTTANVISENLGFRDLNATEQLLLTCNSRSGGYGYGYGYGYGNGGNSYGYGYGYGYGGSTKNIKVYGSILADSDDYVNGPCQLVLRIVLHSADSSAVNGVHTLFVEGNIATPKTSGDASFSITQPNCTGSQSSP